VRAPCAAALPGRAARAPALRLVAPPCRTLACGLPLRRGVVAGTRPAQSPSCVAALQPPATAGRAAESANFLDLLVHSLLTGAPKRPPCEPEQRLRFAVAGSPGGEGDAALPAPSAAAAFEAKLAAARENVVRLLGFAPTAAPDEEECVVDEPKADASSSAPRPTPFLAVVASRAALRASAAWLALFARRTRYALLNARAVNLADRTGALRLLSAPSLAAQLAQLAALPAERAAGLLACLERGPRAALLDALDATARGAELSVLRPSAAAAQLARISALRVRAAVVEAMPRVAAAAAMRAMDVSHRAETMAALGREARAAMAALLPR
jgi:hypothetical protein